MKEIWNQRYGAQEYFYGKAPNVYFKSYIDKLKPGRILLPGEGEGRNAVYAASKGWDVFAFDQSEVGMEKALKLASDSNVEINYIISDYLNFETQHRFGLIALIYTHSPSSIRELFHKKIINYLKPNGHLVLECFNKKQINHTTGGPKDLDMLYSKEVLKNDFSSLSTINISEGQVMLEEGSNHLGIAEVVRASGIR